jgi:3-dehydroquinate dehydratase II
LGIRINNNKDTLLLFFKIEKVFLKLIAKHKFQPFPMPNYLIPNYPIPNYPIPNYLKTMSKKKIIIINGPNLNLLGRREPEIYGHQTFEQYFDVLKDKYADTVDLEYFQSNHEGALIDKIHEVGFSYEGIVLNAGAFTHSSIAIADAIAGVKTPAVEVHISNVYAREEFRHHSFLSKNSIGIIIGFGLRGYDFAIQTYL